MFDIIIDSAITDVRDRAKLGNHDSMLFLAICLAKGEHTRADTERALHILDHLLTEKERMYFKETYWNTICQKCQILAERGEYDTIDELMVELIRDMSRFPPEEWRHMQMVGAADWLRNRAVEVEDSSSQD